MGKGVFITGTDTDVGKTWSTVALMRWFQRQGYKVCGMKPVAAGCEWHEGTLKNRDALLIQENSSIAVEYEQVNPYAFELPISPHLACGDEKVDPLRIVDVFSGLLRCADVVIVEGAGGWFSPLGVDLDNARLAVEMNLPVIMVVGIKLGCLNHAKLTYQAIQRSGGNCAGWIAVELVPDMPAFEANINFLKQLIAAPLLATMPHITEEDFDYLASNFSKNIESLIAAN